MIVFDDQMPSPFLGESLASARRRVRQGRDEGMDCPCCDQWVQRYQRRIYATVAREMIRCHLAMPTGPGGWVHISTILGPSGHGGGGDFAKLVYWGLAEEMPRTTRTQRSGRVGGGDSLCVASGLCRGTSVCPNTRMSTTADAMRSRGRPYRYSTALEKTFRTRT
jgi:hypothetical protein